MKNYFTSSLPAFHLWTDILLLNISFLITHEMVLTSLAPFSYHAYLNLFLVSNLIWILCINVFRLYSFTRVTYNSYSRFLKLILAITVHLFFLELFVYVSGEQSGFSENLVFISYKIFTFLALLTHGAATLVLQYLRKSGYNLKRYVIIGNGDLSGLAKGFYDNRQELGYFFCGTFKIQNMRTQAESLENFIETERPDYIYCCLSEMNNEQIKDVIRLAERKKTHVRLVPDYHGFLNNKFAFEPRETYPIINVQTKAFTEIDEQFTKRAFDIAFSSVIMILGLPVFLLVMLLVKVSSKGTVFFMQDRTGRWGQTFKIIKFRTMYMDAHTYGLQHSLGKKDPRLTPVGNFLRRTRLDELPQFLNVLMGQMSIVGPRPLNQYDVDMLMKEASHEFQKVLTIRPGITSIGQVKVGYATSSSENLLRLKYDMLYLNTYSLVTDLYVIGLTIQVVLLGKGR
ncbi:hypothetical protein DYBT9623_01264 [Dyadobacter sp. CECT 9623]|uniref:Bacterial sugar transferase domain-containing protein n=1 Tax=Dyadobacter linearis TaxID=2823330 RepID=A0ABM8UM04_9BACT|nr:exopolysaccharide biosynthesis polyprenyl glycosylphosphotransferase [Dyadobacter sp. CECT 9623]CAG5068533.1 hypothetical protein DYBT9623_01264 [Dyadobacter sp. CECT 9623]